MFEKLFISMNHRSLFSGIGGFDIAAEWVGWKNIFQVEIDDFCNKVLEKHFPDVQRFRDIKEFRGEQFRGRVDVISGGFPCQPFSQAGKRKGKEDERYLWPEMLRIIREIQPNWVVGENVPGIVNWSRGMVFDQVQNDLETEGYKVFAVILPACSVNAPHKRDRVWFIANNNKVQRKCVGECGVQDKKQKQEKVRSKNWSDFELVGNGTIFKEWRSQGTGYLPQPFICRGGNGLSDWMDRYESLGNAIVPQVAYEIFKAIDKTQRS